MCEWNLGYEGFICQYMVTGPKVCDYKTELTDSDQFRLERRLREEVAGNFEYKSFDKNIDIHVGEISPVGMPWETAISEGNGFVDRSAFYSTLKKIELITATNLVADKDTTATIRLWSYMAAVLFVNGEAVGEIKTPVYKPINRTDVEVRLNKGENRVIVCCVNLGVRDTRNIVGLQVISEAGNDNIKVTLPDERLREFIYEDQNYLSSIMLHNGKLSLGNRKVFISYPEWKTDYEEKNCSEEITATGDFAVPKGKRNVLVKLKSEKNYSLSRLFETSFDNPEKQRSENRENYLKKIAGVKSANRGEFGFSIMNILARKALGEVDKKDRDRFLEDLKLIEKRVDCADFLLCGVIRYIKNYKVDEELKERIKDVLLGFRYWMNMSGSDGMCFWSENHSLMFYSCMMLAGSLYPEDFFLRAKMTGKELSRYGEKKLKEWLDDVEEYGFEEFLSATYLNVTFAALLNVVDFAPDDISKRAESLCDRVLKELSLHTFRGSMIAPMGRVYRGVITPYSEGIQGLIHQINNDAPDANIDGWLSYLATSKYKIKDSCKEIMEKDADTAYSTGNALIAIKKTRNYCLTSVQSPRRDGFSRWTNVRVKEADVSNEIVDSHEYLKSANESFHGTTFFEPGTCGYQQHLWYAALSERAFVFVNHPGCMTEESDMRPGYWHGNGIIPAIRQEKNVLGAVYFISDDHPVGFTHVFFPKEQFDEVIADNMTDYYSGASSWIFLRKENGYLALWCSEMLCSCNERLFDCELRAYSRNCAYMVVCGSLDEYADFDKFIDSVKKIKVSYKSDLMMLELEGKEFLRWYQSSDCTQII